MSATSIGCTENMRLHGEGLGGEGMGCRDSDLQNERTVPPQTRTDLSLNCASKNSQIGEGVRVSTAWNQNTLPQ